MSPNIDTYSAVTISDLNYLASLESWRSREKEAFLEQICLALKQTSKIGQRNSLKG